MKKPDIASSPLALRILDSIFRASTSRNRRIVLQPFYSEPESSQEWGGKLLTEQGSMDGLILLPYAGRKPRISLHVASAYEAAGKPVVTMNPFEPNITKNFVSTDLWGTARTIGRAFVQTGRRRVLLLIHTGLHHSPTFLPRLAGLQMGVSEAGLCPTDTVRLAVSKNVFEESGYEAIKEYLSRCTEAPDAIYCMGDYLAFGAIDALKEAGLSVPENVSIIGGTGLELPGKQPLPLTQLCHPFDEIAEAMITMLLERIAKENADMPGVYVTPFFKLGGTTRVEENALLTDYPRQ